MSRKHTPGPWHVGTHRPQMVYDNDGFMVADLSLFLGPDAPAPSEERLANARLTAAAPELLAALKDVLAHVEDETAPRINNQCTLCSTYRKRIRAAIARAEGGAQ